MTRSDWIDGRASDTRTTGGTMDERRRAEWFTSVTCPIYGCTLTATHSHTRGDVAAQEITAAQLLVKVAQATSLPAYVEQTGGNTATIYVGTPDDDGRYALAIGPGSFDWGAPDASTFYVGTFGIGPDDDGEADMTYVESLDDVAHIVARLLACEGYNVGGSWVNCDRTDKHGHGIESD